MKTRIQRNLALRPILNVQARHATEFLVSAYEGQSVRPGDGRDLEVVWPKNPALNFQLMPDFGVVPCRSIVEREGSERRKKHFQGAQPALAIAVFLRAMPQLGLNNGTQENVRDRLRPDLGVKCAARVASEGKSRGWCPAERPLPRLSLLEFTLRRPFKRFAAELPRDARKKIGRQTVGPGGTVLGLHQFQCIAYQFFQGRRGFDIQRLELGVQLFGNRRHGLNVPPRSPAGKQEFQAGQIVNLNQPNQP